MKGLRVLVTMGLGFLIGAPAWAASYTVPTLDPQLSPYAHFEISDLRVEKGNGALRVTYSLPLELTGDPVTIELTGEESLHGGRVRLRGELGKANCVGASCEVDYRHLPINRAAVTARLWDISETQEEFDARLQLAMEFEGNPIGIVNLDAPLFTAPASYDRKPAR